MKTETKDITIIKVGSKVFDDLTRTEATVIGVNYSEGKTPSGLSIGCVGYWLDNDYLGGGRHPWEVTEL